MGPHRKDGRKGGIGWVLPEPRGRRVTFGARPFFLFGEK